MRSAQRLLSCDMSRAWCLGDFVSGFSYKMKVPECSCVEMKYLPAPKPKYSLKPISVLGVSSSFVSLSLRHSHSGTSLYVTFPFIAWVSFRAKFFRLLWCFC